MTRSRRWLPVLALLAAAATLAAPGRALAEEDARVYFAPEDDFPRALVEQLLKAKKRIDIAMYSFHPSSKQGEEDYAALRKEFGITALDALREVAGKGVKVRMVQVGARDEAGLIGGIGICGQTLCCSTWLKDFRPISIQMAKRQNLSLNPSKISGQCGRLLCCLAYENDQYEKPHKKKERGRASASG